MPVLGFNHINIRTPDFIPLVKFLREALGMRVSSVPGHESMEQAAWVYDGSGNAVIHLASADVPYSSNEVLPDEPPRGSGAIHHIAFSCEDFDGMRERLSALNLPFRENHVARANLKQIFVQVPTDIVFELNFGAV